MNKMVSVSLFSSILKGLNILPGGGRVGKLLYYNVLYAVTTRCVAVAVSGGSDSVALTYLTGQVHSNPLAIIVDHR